MRPATKIMDAIMAHAGRSLMAQPKVDEVLATTITWNSILLGLMEPAATPEPRLNSLADLLWRLVSSRTITTVEDHDVDSIHFAGWVESKLTGKSKCAVMLPSGWLKKFAVDPWLQAGAVVHTASKGRDFWNSRIHSGQNKASVFAEADAIELRAKAYEAMFLRLAETDESQKRFKATTYQKAVLASFPTFPTEHMYESKPFDFPTATLKFEDFSGRGIRPPVMPSGGAK